MTGKADILRERVNDASGVEKISLLHQLAKELLECDLKEALDICEKGKELVLSNKLMKKTVVPDKVIKIMGNVDRSVSKIVNILQKFTKIENFSISNYSQSSKMVVFNENKNGE